ncbi:TMEM165/GDT1 family protein [Halarchaeum sp. CBA1220]|uniref:TMEM165/GDT1 family protein n=1 Tax=Halarchaeum sp. CBA1220 TaxID=1853682 RepID=UPI000F3A8E59|nr:TMEM165/GDT1 family protein [Halarchaeum sp. CBA1220]QLC34112.1 TMEM165/GDT1 family protein [Halarchaeum sp. CBA1220]
MYALPLAAGNGLDAVIQRYAGYGPFLAAFLANFLATFGDKGQLVVITLASRYDAKRVFAGAMAAFAGWSALEVVFGAWLTGVLPQGAIGTVTGVLFLAFGLWTAYTVYGRYRRGGVPGASADGGTVAMLPDRVARYTRGYGPVATAFCFIVLAEVGDKTQLLTINLAATFPDAPVPVFLGVIAALGIRTGVDAFLGERVERLLPTAYIEVAAAVVFVAFGVVELGVVGENALFGALALALAIVGYGSVRHR